MEIMDLMSSALGLDRSAEELQSLHMVARGIVVYVISLLIVKLAKKRFMGQTSALDVVMVIILGSVLSRGINGSAPFVPTLVAGVTLVLVHRAMSWATYRWKRFASFVEGEPSVLVRDGRIDWDQMRKHDITERDLRSAMRVLANTEDMSAIKTMYLEPNGKHSIVKAS